MNDCSIENEKKRKLNSESPAPNLTVDLNPPKRQLQLQPPVDDVTKINSWQEEQRSRTNPDIFFCAEFKSKGFVLFAKRKFSSASAIPAKRAAKIFYTYSVKILVSYVFLYLSIFHISMISSQLAS